MTKPQQRGLPGHLAAALQDAGGTADGAGQPWAGRNLETQHHQFDGDDGTADKALVSALNALASGLGDETAVVGSLSQARLFVPIVAELSIAEVTAGGVIADKESDMTLVSVQAPDGRRALPVFSDIQRLQHWLPDARPVPVYAPRIALSAVAEEAQLLVIDPAAELTFVVRRPALWALAQQRQWLPSYRDAELQARIREMVRAALLESDIAGLTKFQKFERSTGLLKALEILPGSGLRTRLNNGGAEGLTVTGGGLGPELRLVLFLGAGLQKQELTQLLSRVQESLVADQLFTERVDSLEISVQSIADEDVPE